MRKLYRDAEGVIRFKGNPVVRFVLDEATAGRKCDMNTVWRTGFPHAALREFYELIDYSVCGYAEVFPQGAPTDRAWEAMEKMPKKRTRGRS